MTQQTDGLKLTKLQYEVLCEMPSDSEFCIGYVHLTQIGDRDTLRPVIKQLRDMGFVEYLRGLMTEDGEVAGSGFCRFYKKNDEIERLIEEYEKQPEQKTYTQQELDQAISQAKEEALNDFVKFVDEKMLIKNRCIEKDGGTTYPGSMSIIKIAELYKLSQPKKDL